MSSRSSKRNNRNKNQSSNASDAGSVKEFVERDIDEDVQQLATSSEPTSAETRPAEPSVPAPVSPSRNVTSEEPPKVSPTSSVYGEVFKDDPPAVQVAILEPEIAVATPAGLPQEPIPIQENSGPPSSDSGWFSSLFACCVSRK